MTGRGSSATVRCSTHPHSATPGRWLPSPKLGCLHGKTCAIWMLLGRLVAAAGRVSHRRPQRVSGLWARGGPTLGGTGPPRFVSRQRDLARTRGRGSRPAIAAPQAWPPHLSVLKMEPRGADHAGHPLTPGPVPPSRGPVPTRCSVARDQTASRSAPRTRAEDLLPAGATGGPRG